MTKLKWGMIGGGEGSQIGPAHRLGAVADGRFELVAGALDHRPAKGKAFAESLGIDSSRAYGSWSEMLDGEKDYGIKEYTIIVKERNFISNMRTVYREGEDQFPGVDTTMEESVR